MAGKGPIINLGELDISLDRLEQKAKKAKEFLSLQGISDQIPKRLKKDFEELERSFDNLYKNRPGANAPAKDLLKYQQAVEKLGNQFEVTFGHLSSFKIDNAALKGTLEVLKDLKKQYDEAAKAAENYKEKIGAQGAIDTSKYAGYRDEKGVQHGIKGAPTGYRQRIEDADAAAIKAAQEGKVGGISSAYADVLTSLRKKRDTINQKESKNQTLTEEDIEQLNLINEFIQEITTRVKSIRGQAGRLQELNKNAEEKSRALEDAAANESGKLNIALQESTNLTKEASSEAVELAEAYRSAGRSATDLETANKSLDKIGNRLKQIFSITTIFTTVRRVVRSAINDFQELDKQFNEIAIVSKYSTKEMWASFSQVNAMAQEYGVTTKNILEVQNLYYHQGKEMAEVNKLTEQTLTLAKITGMDYADATNKLTAALNAYKIAAEDANRVTDTVAALSANAATSSEELMTALTKTASIAANAGMSLENTEVFLTKMIETTREAPENLGTALKTIVARFGEVKQEIDGEMVETADINKVDKALKSVGMTLLDSAGQVRDLDDVFMELSSKWDDLDRNTQRYIATQAAGSRQQSRFIAMMENYDRTLELVEVAQDSAGTGARQLAKAQESIETALNRLKSTWQEFYSNFITSGMIRGALDFANALLTGLNKISDISPVLGLLTTTLTIWFVKTQLVEKGIKKLSTVFTKQSVQILNEAGIIKTELNPAMQKESILTSALTKATLAVAAAKETEAVARRKVAEAKREEALAGASKKWKYSPRKTILDDENTTNMQNQINNAVYGGIGSKDETKAILARFNKYKPGSEEILNNYEKQIKSIDLIKDKFKEGWSEMGENPILQKGLGGFFSKESWKNAGKTVKEGMGGIKKAVVGKLTEIAPMVGKAAKLVFNPIGLTIIGVTATITAAVLIWKKLIRASLDDTKAVEKLEKAQTSYNDALKKTNSLRKNYKSLQELQNKSYLTEDERNQEQELIKEMVQEYPNLLEKIDEEGNYHIKNSEVIQKEIKAQEDLLKTKQDNYEKLRLQNVRQGIYSDTSTAAGQALVNLKDYFSATDKDQWKEIAKEADKYGGFNKSEFYNFAEAYQKGEKTSFGYKDFNNLFAGWFDNQEDYNKMLELYSQNLKTYNGDVEKAMAASLEQSDAYHAGTSSIQETAKVFASLNSQMGNFYSDLLEGAGGELKEIYVQQAKVHIENSDQFEDYSSESKDLLSKIFAAEADRITKEKADYITEYGSGNKYLTKEERNKIQKYKETDNYWFSETGEGRRSVLVEKLAQEEATEYLDSLAKSLEGHENVINSYFENLGSEVFTTEEFQLPDYIRKLFADENVANQLEASIKELLAKTKEKNQEWARDNSLVTWLMQNNITEDQVTALREKTANLGEKEAAAYIKGFQDQVNNSNLTGTALQKMENAFLGVNPTDLESIITGLPKIAKAGGDAKSAILTFGSIAPDAFANTDNMAQALNSTLETTKNQLEGLGHLAEGKGSLTELEGAMEILTQGLDYSATISMLSDIGNAVTVTADGIGLNVDMITKAQGLLTDSSGDMYETLAAYLQGQIEMHQTELQATMTELEGKIQANAAEVESKIGTVKAVAKLTDEELKILGQSTGAYAAAANTLLEIRQKLTGLTANLVKVRAIGALASKQIKDVGKSAKDAAKEAQDAAEKAKKAWEDFVKFLRGFDKYSNLDKIIETFEEKLGHLEYEIKFTTNSKLIEKDVKKQINLINNQIAANRGGQQAAQENLQMWRNVIQQRNSGYVAFDADGNALVNAQKLKALQEQIRDANEEDAEILQAQYDEIMANVEAYDKEKKKVEDYSKALEGNFDKLQSVLDDTYNSIVNLENKIIEVIQAREDKELQAVKDKYSAIQEENDRYLNSVRKMVDKEREIRDRQNTEDEIEAKERRLAMLRMSGGSKKEIRALEKEIAQDRQDLSDANVDRMIEDLEERFNTQAEEQNKETTYLENALNERREKRAYYIEEAKKMMEQGSDEVIAYLMANDQEYLTASEAGKELWKSSTEKLVNQGIASYGLLVSNGLTPTSDALTVARENAESFDMAVQQYAETAVAKNGEVQSSVASLTNYYKELVKGVTGQDGLISALDKLAQKYNELAAAKKNAEGNGDGTSLPKSISSVVQKPSEQKPITNEGNISKYTDTATGKSKLAPMPKAHMEPVLDKNGNINKANTLGNWKATGTSIVVDGQKYWRVESGLNPFDTDPRYVLDDPKLFVSKKAGQGAIHGGTTLYVKRFAQGGMVDFTGPAWVDGTKTKPEAFLSASDAENIAALRDTLSYIYSQPTISNSQPISSSSSATYNITIQVDSISNDYDVDQAINRIEEKISKASKYRNINILKNSK